MKKLLFTLAFAAATTGAFAAETPFIWGFGNAGIYSGYQLYGSIVNKEPVAQLYTEVNVNLLCGDFNLGYLGAGVWINNDLTSKRMDSMRQVLNEIDPNVHYGFTWWFDDACTIGLGYRTSVVCYYYPVVRNNTPITTTVDWNHSIEFINPIATPYIDMVHEYRDTHANLYQFGLKRSFQIDNFSITPSVNFVARDSKYGWCFAGFGWYQGQRIPACLATLRVQLDLNYAFNEYCGIFAKVAYCRNLDSKFRDASEASYDGAPGEYNDFFWGGVGVNFNF